MVDDCWQSVKRDAKSHLISNPTTFTDGMGALGVYIHSKNFKFGIYSNAGSVSRNNMPSSLTFEAIDAADFVKWQVDYLKYDSFNA